MWEQAKGILVVQEEPPKGNAYAFTRISFHTYSNQINKQRYAQCTYTHACRIHPCVYTQAHTYVSRKFTHSFIGVHTCTHMCIYMFLYIQSYTHQYRFTLMYIVLYSFSSGCMCTQNYLDADTHPGIHRNTNIETRLKA